MFNKELVDKYKFELSVLKSGQVKDLEPMLKMIKENEPDVTPLVGPPFPVGGFLEHGPLIQQLSINGVANLDESKTGTLDAFKVVNLYEIPSYIEQLKMMHRWYKEGYINKDALTQGVDISKKFQAKKAFAAVGDLDITADLQIGVPKPNISMTIRSGIEIIQVPLQIPPMSTARKKVSMQAISRTSEDPARAMMLLNLFYKDKKLLTLFNFGVEGKHYVMKDGQIALPEGKTNENIGFYHDIMWQIGNQFINYTRVGEDLNKYENYKKLNEMVVKRKTFGFLFDQTPVKNELISIASVRSEFDPGLNMGLLDPDENLPKLLDKLKAAGSDKLIAEAQKQLDAWRTANGK